MDENKGFAVGTKKCGLLCGVIGALAALCWILLGFWKMNSLAAMFAVGYIIGACDHKAELVKKIVDRFVPKKGE